MLKSDGEDKKKDNKIENKKEKEKIYICMLLANIHKRSSDMNIYIYIYIFWLHFCSLDVGVFCEFLASSDTYFAFCALQDGPLMSRNEPRMKLGLGLWGFFSKALGPLRWPFNCNFATVEVNIDAKVIVDVLANPY